MEVIDNYLPEHLFKPIEEFFMFSGIGYSHDNCATNIRTCQWSFRNHTNHFDDGYYQFYHPVFDNNYILSDSFSLFEPIFKHENIMSLYRIQSNLNPSSEKLKFYGNGFHTDNNRCNDENPPCMTTSILYINTNDGYTQFEESGERVESVRNRMLKFPCHLKHTGTNCTDEQMRIVVNFNWF